MSKSKSKGEKFWKPLVSEWLQSSLGQPEFCRKNGISIKSFYYWKRKFSTDPVIDSKNESNPSDVKFVEVCEELTPIVKEIKTPVIKAPRFIIIRSANGCVIEVPL